MAENKYTEDSIQKLDPLSFTRLRPDTYLGSNENSTQLAREIITNCYDEFLAGNCTEIWVEYNEKNNTIKISDNGQGIIPNVEKDNGRTILEMVYGDINTSGKYDKSDDAVYKVSTGAFGIGASLTNFLSHWLIAITKRDGQFEKVFFKEGVFEKRESGTCDKSEHGVEVEFQPSEEFFRNAAPNIKALEDEFFNMSCVCAGLKIHFMGQVYYHPNGLQDLLKKYVENDVTLFDDSFYFNCEEGRQSLDFIMTYTTNAKAIFDCFCNYSIVESGTPVTAVKSCITRVLNKWGKDNKIIKDKNLSGSDLQEGIVCIFNLASPNIRYDSQTKVRVTSTEDNSFLNSNLAKELEIWLDNNPADGKNIINKALVARKAAEAAKKAREAVKNKASNIIKPKKKLDLPSKLTDCYSKEREKCELMIVEGDSASGNLKKMRDNEFQAILPVRGKVLNVETATLAAIDKNAEIQDMLNAFGLTKIAGQKRAKYDKNALRYGKIILMTDADVDGAHIKNLLMTFIWKYVPELIEDGYVYAAVPPLYRLRNDKEVIYLTDDAALDEFKAKNNISKFQVSRLKGLGEMDDDETEEALLDPANRIIKQITVDDIGATTILFQQLMGKDSSVKKKFIEENEGDAEIYV